MATKAQNDEVIARRHSREDEITKGIVDRAVAAGTARKPSGVTVRFVDPATLKRTGPPVEPKKDPSRIYKEPRRAPVELELSLRKAASTDMQFTMKPCEGCGLQFTPMAPRQVKCDDCRYVICAFDGCEERFIPKSTKPGRKSYCSVEHSNASRRSNGAGSSPSSEAPKAALPISDALARAEAEQAVAPDSSPEPEMAPEVAPDSSPEVHEFPVPPPDGSRYEELLYELTRDVDAPAELRHSALEKLAAIQP